MQIRGKKNREGIQIEGKKNREGIQIGGADSKKDRDSRERIRKSGNNLLNLRYKDTGAHILVSNANLSLSFLTLT